MCFFFLHLSCFDLETATNSLNHTAVKHKTLQKRQYRFPTEFHHIGECYLRSEVGVFTWECGRFATQEPKHWISVTLSQSSFSVSHLPVHVFILVRLTVKPGWVSKEISTLNQVPEGTRIHQECQSHALGSRDTIKIFSQSQHSKWWYNWEGNSLLPKVL